MVIFRITYRWFLYIAALVYAVPVYGQDVEFSDISQVQSLNSEAEEILPLVSADGSILYFCRVFSQENIGGDFAGSDIWWSEFSGEGWSTPKRVGTPVNNRDNNAVIGINSNGNLTYLMNAYQRNGGIAFVEGKPDAWTRPEVISLETVNSEGFVGMYISPDYKVMLLSLEKSSGRGKEDLYVSLRDSVSGKWSVPESLGSTINTAGFEISPFLSADKKYLFFASEGHGGYGDADLFVSRRLYDRWDVWSAPVNLGPEINSSGFDAYLSLAEDSTVYFSSNRNGMLSDIFQARMENRTKSGESLDAQKIIAEAEAILNELRETNVKEEEFITFEPGQTELNEEARENLRQLTNRLKYTDYSSFHLLTVDPENSMTPEVQQARIEEVKRFISVMGIGGKNIFDYPATQQVTLKDGTVFKSAEGILIIVKD